MAQPHLRAFTIACALAFFVPASPRAEDAPAALAAAVQPWLAARDDVSAAALQWARRYSLDAALDRLCTVYQECLGMA